MEGWNVEASAYSSGTISTTSGQVTVADQTAEFIEVWCETAPVHVSNPAANPTATTSNIRLKIDEKVRLPLRGFAKVAGICPAGTTGNHTLHVNCIRSTHTGGRG